MSAIPDDWRPILEVIVGLLTAACVLPYVRDIRRGETHPHRMSWVVFAALSTAATVAQFADQGMTSAVFLTGGAAVGFATVSLLSIRHGVGGSSPTDIAALVGLAFVLAVWARTDDEVLIVVLIIAIEIPAIIATFVKSLRSPDSETRSTWLIDGLAGALAIVAAESMSFHLIVYPAYHALANLSIVAAITLGARRASV